MRRRRVHRVFIVLENAAAALKRQAPSNDQTWKDRIGSENEPVSGKKVTADAACPRESILKPAASVRQGFNNPDVGMPPCEGILSDSQVESVILYLRGLSSR